MKKSYKNPPVWNDLLKVKDLYLKGRSVVIGDGKSTSFWHDRWCGLVSLADKFPRLFEISEDLECTVETMKQRRWKLKLRRWLHEDLQNQLGRLQDIVYRCCTNGNKDSAIWDWEKSGVFLVKSTYKHLCKNEYGPNNKRIWKARIPLKIKILCGWFLKMRY